MNSSINKKSILIIGQGIAGSILAWCFMKAGHYVLIVDENHHESSSIISAGIRNPITGQRLALTPQFDLFAACADRVYSQMSTELDQNFFIPKPIIRVLRSHDELERACRIKPYIKAIHKPGHYGSTMIDPYGSLEISQGGYFKTHLLLNSLRKYFLGRKMLIAEHFSYDDLKLNEQYAQWKSEKFNTVIFCEGFKAQNNPWFKELPYNFAKGELLKVSFQSPALPDAIICQQQWCLPAENGTYLVGSTYDRLNINSISTEQGRSNILKGLSDFILAKPHVIEHYAAVRPVMLNQKPIITAHPSTPRMWIFNGFASKGFLCVPYYAQMFVEQIQ